MRLIDETESVSILIGSLPDQRQQKKIPCAWKQSGGITSPLMPLPEKTESCLKSESDAAADHAKVIFRAIDDVPAEVAHDADVGG